MGARMAVPWDELAARVDIVSVIGEHVQLRRSGRSWVGLCPFHPEKTPSFNVNPERQFFYCFGCQAGGDVYTFLMRYRGISFMEAAEEVARRAGVDLGAFAYSERDRQAWERRRRLLAACRAATAFFRHALTLPAAAPARRYLRERGLGDDVCERFEIGYAPDDGRALADALQQAGVSEEAAVEAGLLTPSRTEGGRPRPRFRGRLMFPIRDPRGQVVGFGARKLSDAAWGPKYLNSPQTDLFNKGELLFGLWEAREAIRDGGFGLLVEGYTDVLTLHQAGVAMAVATLGTALTPQQAALLERYAREVVVAFDGDGAGERAALRSLDILAAAGMRVRVLLLPRGHDPDSCVKQEGAEGFRQRMDQAVPLTEFRLKLALRGQRVDTVEGRARAVEAILPVLAQVVSAVELEGYVRRLSRALEVSEQALWADLERFRRGRTRAAQSRAAGPSRAAGSARYEGTAPRHTLAAQRHNKRGFASGAGEVETAARRRRQPAAPQTRTRVPADAREAAIRRAERGLVRRMMAGAEDALAVWRALGGVGLFDPELQAAAEALVQQAAVAAGEGAPGGPGEGVSQFEHVLAPLRELPVPEAEQWRGWARWLREQRLRAALQSIEGRLDAGAECAEDNREACRLLDLLAEYYGLRVRMAADKEWPSTAAKGSSP